ncbi:hypothetical protein RJT34_33363 [Clitoria ternatea]|uniref:Uncharacterized protein n=1 Tax=Clitoria ternatea TaxID=43366 RepID=A0AAN9F1X6_CLITE
MNIVMAHQTDEYIHEKIFSGSDMVFMFVQPGLVLVLNETKAIITMDSKVKSKSDKSLCEKSMSVVVNVIRLSSFSIAQKTLGATSTRKGGKERSGCDDDSDMNHEKQPLVPDQFSSTRRSQQPQSRANPTYVIKSLGSNGSTEHVIYKERSVLSDVDSKKEQCVDGLASDYISKIRNKLGRGL